MKQGTPSTTMVPQERGPSGIWYCLAYGPAPMDDKLDALRAGLLAALPDIKVYEVDLIQREMIWNLSRPIRVGGREFRMIRVPLTVRWEHE